MAKKRGRPVGAKGKKEPKAKAVKPAKQKKMVAAPETEAATISVQVITAPKLKALLASLRTASEHAATASGTLRQIIGDAVEHDHVDKWALGVVRALERLEPEKAALRWDVLGLYMERAGMLDRLAAVPEFNFVSGGKPVERPAAEPAVDEQAEDNVVQMPARDVAEQAGAA
jgi:hypothetical protein